MRWLCVAHEKEIPDFHGLAKNKGDLKTHALGIGQFEALARFSQLAYAEKPERVVLAGTCGSRLDENIFKVFASNHFAFPKIAHEDLPEFLPRAFITERAVDSGILPAATVLQNHGVSLDAEKFASNTGYIPPEFPGTVLENMEAASVALICKKMNIPFTALLCVTNTIGIRARAQWKQNFREAGERLSATLLLSL